MARSTKKERQAALRLKIDEILAPHGLSLADVLPAPKKGLAQSNGNDDVMTPDDLALAVVRHFQPVGKICEPCSGKGAFLRAFERYNVENDTDPKPENYDANARRVGELENQILRVSSFEIKEGKDFLNIDPEDSRRWNWIISNPPWSLLMPFTGVAMRRADNIVWLDKMNAFGFKARLRVLAAAGFCIREYALFDSPPEWPSMGLQTAAIHLSRARPGEGLGTPRISQLDWKPKPKTIVLP